MGPPTPPLALSPANLALLQQRPAPAAPRAPTPADSTDAAKAPPPPHAASGRGRLIDILA